ncbi:MAG: extracellular solute-binding protein [Clostridia bacterium]|nr:extracellular solute-binding protein [Clostridia bacterium]
MRKRIIAIFAAAVMAAGLVSCGGGTAVEEADSRESIWVSIFNGGYGRVWIDNIVNDYNAAHPENKYKINIRSSKDEFNQIMGNIQSGTAPYDIFYSNNYLYKLIDGGYLEDLSSVWDSKPEGSDRTVRQMMVGAEDYAAAYGDGKGGVYGLPHYESVRGFVYDHELFLKYGLLFGEDGNFIESPTDKLSVGKDGVAGTYDDGQPETEQQWDDMVTKATLALGYAFNYTGKFSNYLNDIYESISAQVDGVDDYLTNFTVNGSYDFRDGNGRITINHENGYLLSQMRGKEKALEFMDKYLACKDTKLGIKNPYTYPNSSTLSYSHTDAQSDFITFTAKNKTKKIGMLIEGDWWENESKEVFNDLNAAGYSDYAFRNHEYRFMTLPRFDDQAEAVNVYSVPDSMYLAMVKQTDGEKAAICKDFITFAYQPKYISAYTVITGGVMPYDVPLSAEQKAQLSPFTRNYLELYSDRVNNKFVNTQLYMNKYLTCRGGLGGGTTSNGEHYVVINGLYYYSASDYFTKLYNYNTTNWAKKMGNYEAYMSARA